LLEDKDKDPAMAEVPSSLARTVITLLYRLFPAGVERLTKKRDSPGSGSKDKKKKCPPRKNKNGKKTRVTGDFGQYGESSAEDSDVEFIGIGNDIGGGGNVENENNDILAARKRHAQIIGVHDIRSSQDTVELRDRFIARVKALGLPPNPLDDLIMRHEERSDQEPQEQEGRNRVAEMTGRKSSLVRSANGTYTPRKRPDDENQRNRVKFQKGELRVAVISAAASVGFSLHDIKSANDDEDYTGRKRVHLT
jgi:hypothetical protein